MSDLAVLSCHGTPVGSRRLAVWSFIVALLHLRVSAARVLLVPAALVVVVIVCSCALRCSNWRAGRLSAEATSMCNSNCKWRTGACGLSEGWCGTGSLQTSSVRDGCGCRVTSVVSTCVVCRHDTQCQTHGSWSELMVNRMKLRSVT